MSENDTREWINKDELLAAIARRSLITIECTAQGHPQLVWPKDAIYGLIDALMTGIVYTSATEGVPE